MVGVPKPVTNKGATDHCLSRSSQAVICEWLGIAEFADVMDLDFNDLSRHPLVIEEEERRRRIRELKFI
jgi:hypothetical protein